MMHKLIVGSNLLAVRKIVKIENFVKLKMSNPKKRGTNFSNNEKYLLIELVTKYKDVVENKKTDAVFAKEKIKCWDEICKKFNCESNIFRDAVTLKNCWENLKKRTRKYYAEERSKLYKTGGGPHESQYDPVMEKIHIIIKPSVDGLTNEFDNDNIENNQNSYCENELEDNNDDSNIQGNTTVPLENLFEEIPSSDAEDSVLKYVGTTQETPEYTESFPALASIKKRKLDDMKRDMSNKNMPFKQSGQKNKQHINLQFRNTNNFNKNCNVSEEKSGPSKPTINSSKQLQDIAINCDTSSEENECPTDKDDFGITQRKIVNTGTKTKEKSAVNVLRKKMNKPIQIRGENVQFNSDCAKTFPQTKKNYSMSDKVLNFATLAKSKTELVDVMKADIDEKHAIEVNILNMQLKREILQVQLIEKEIAIKECILKRVKKTETLEDIENLNM